MELKIKNEENRESLEDTLHHLTYFTATAREPKLSLIVPLKQSIFKVEKKINRSHMEHFAKKLRKLDRLLQTDSYPEPDRLKVFKSGTLQEASEMFPSFIPLLEERNSIEQFIHEATSFLYHRQLEPANYIVYVIPSRIGVWDPYVSNYIRPFIQSDEEAILVESKHFNRDRYSYLITFKGEST